MAKINVRCFKMTKKLFLEGYGERLNSSLMKRVIVGFKAKRRET